MRAITAIKNMIKPIAVISAIGTILFALVTASVLNTMPDPNRVIVNSLPDTKPDIKATANQALDIKDTSDSLQEKVSWVWSFDKLLLVLGVPSAVIGGLVLRAFR